MIKISKEDLKKNNISLFRYEKMTVEQARTIAEIIYHLLEIEFTEQENNNAA